MTVAPRTVGILALQGAHRAHAEHLASCGARPVEIRTPADLDPIDALVIPGGESTTISKLLGLQGLFDPLARRLASGLPAMGTCAGMILLARHVLDGRADQRSLGAIDLTVRRNAFGRQVDSFETDLAVAGISDGPVHAVFIRAPIVEAVGDGVEILATVAGHPVACRSERVLVTSFHPELTADSRMHRFFLDVVVAGAST